MSTFTPPLSPAASMSTFTPPLPLTAQQLAKLYPAGLELRQVQVLFRHGERTPAYPRLEFADNPQYWPYCHAASRFTAPVLGPGNTWDTLAFRRRLETFGQDGEAVLAAGPGAAVDGICRPGELTDRGRETTLALGARLRRLYVDELRFLPPTPPAHGELYLRATPIERALESLQQVYAGLYPAPFRHNGGSRTPIVIHSRSRTDENLYPNESSCRRLGQLSRAFTAAAAQRWNDSPEMALLQRRLGPWMPVGERVCVDDYRASCLLDLINASLAHAPPTRLPAAFYAADVHRALNTVTIDQWFRGYRESAEFRRLGVGSLLGDISARALALVHGPSAIKLALMGCHDTTLAGVLASLGCFNGQWPPFTSAITIETFRAREDADSTEHKHAEEQGWYVRIKYNDEPVVVSGCKAPGSHLPGNPAFCTMTAFRQIVERMAPRDWKSECQQNLELVGLPEVELVD